MRQPKKLNDLLIYHSTLDSYDTIELLRAFEQGNLKHVYKQINKKNANCSIGICGYLPLELAIIFDHRHIFDYLVYNLNVNINIKNKSLETMPFVALAFQRRHLLFELLSLDTSTLYDCTSQSQRTLMHEAAINQDAETVYKLINEFGFYRNLNAYELGHLLYDKYSCTPLYYASWFGCVDIVEQLLDCCYGGSYSNDVFAHATDSNDFNNNDSNSICLNDYEEDEDVFSSSRISESNDESLICKPKAKPIKFEDSSLSISILYKRFDCTKLLLTKGCKFNLITSTFAKTKSKSYASTELDCWLQTAMKIESYNEYAEMCDIFHELVLNGAKFSSHIFTLLDSMNELKQFKYLNNGFLTSIDVNNVYQDKQAFNYNICCSYFLQCISFILNYNLESLFNNNLNQCELFLKTIFIKLNELFFVNEKVEIDMSNDLDASLMSKTELFLYDFEQLLRSLYKNGLSFKYFSNKNFFKFLKKRNSVYKLIETHLYSSNTRELGINKVEPLSLINLCKIKIKFSLNRLEVDLINKLPLPSQLNRYISNELANGLPKSYVRNQMNKTFNI